MTEFGANIGIDANIIIEQKLINVLAEYADKTE